MYVLPELPYPYDALEPSMSAKTLRIHHDKHHATYLKTLNEILDADLPANRPLEAVILDAVKTGKQKLFNNAAQVWNHSFFWQAMSATRTAPDAALTNAIDTTFGDLAHLRTAFVEVGAGHFGSGWVWLLADQDGVLRVHASHDAGDPLGQAGATALLVCDLWEHAYYLDFQKDRKGFLEAWFDALANWPFAGRQYEAALGRGGPWRHPAPETGVGRTTAQAG